MHKKILSAAAMAACTGMSLAAAAEESTTVGGKAYIDFTDITQKSNGTRTPPSGLGFDVTRFYLVVNHVFDDIWSASLTTDFNYVSNDSETQVFVKKAYLQAKLADAAVVRVGSADMPWIPYVEDFYGYRWVEKTLIDRLGFGTSADWGAHVGGKVVNGMLNYQVSAVNGNGYKNPSRSKNLDFAGRVGIMPIEGLNLAVGYYTGKLGQDVEPTPPSTADTTVNTASRYDVLAAYARGMFRVGAEYFSAKNFTKTAVSTGPEDKATGYSAWGSFNASEPVAIFARYDSAKPKKDTAPDLKDTYYNVGVAYAARKNVDLAVAYKHDKLDGSGTDAEYSEIGIWSQVKW